MKIVMLCDLYAEGLQYQENMLAKYYVKHGHEVTVIASTFLDADDFIANRPAVGAATESISSGVKIIRLPYGLNVANRLRRFPGVGPILEREKPDLIFLHDIHLNLREAAKHKERNPGCRVIMDYHADYSNSAANWISLTVLHKGIRKAILYRYLSAIDEIFPVVPASADFLHEVYGLPREDLHLLPLGADTDLAKETRAAGHRARIRHKFGIPNDAAVIFSGGKLAPAKRTHLLIEAFNKISDPSLHLLIVGRVPAGDDAYRERLTALLESSPRIHAPGWVDGDEVYAFMDACDFAVFPGSQSVLWQQALSMGLPLVVGRYRGQDCSYMARDGNIISLDGKEIDDGALEPAIRGLLDDRADLKSRQSAALRVTDELLSYDRIVAMTLRRGG